MRMSAKAEYAVRAMIQLATVDDGALVKTDDLAKAQGIPPQFLVDILSDLRTDRLVRSYRGREGGYELARPAADISVADVLRCIAFEALVVAAAGAALLSGHPFTELDRERLIVAVSRIQSALKAGGMHHE